MRYFTRARKNLLKAIDSKDGESSIASCQQRIKDIWIKVVDQKMKNIAQTLVDEEKDWIQNLDQQYREANQRIKQHPETLLNSDTMIRT